MRWRSGLEGKGFVRVMVESGMAAVGLPHDWQTDCAPPEEPANGKLTVLFHLETAACGESFSVKQSVVWLLEIWQGIAETIIERSEAIFMPRA